MKLNKKIIRNIIKEALTELQAYHGTGADFDKFDHKHFLNTGCGSQTFGWGTYVTDDKVIGDSYANNAKKPTLTIDGKTFDSVEDLSVMIGNITNLGEYDAHGLAQRFINTECSPEDVIGTYESDIEFKQQMLGRKWMDDEEQIGELKKLIEYDKSMINVVQNMLKSGRMKNTSNNAFLYEVEIPEDTGTNYIDWYAHFPADYMRRVLRGLQRLKPKYLDFMAQKNYQFKSGMYDYVKHPNFQRIIDIICNDENYYSFFDTDMLSTNGSNLYRQLQRWMGTPKAVSLFLLQCGFVGIKYATGTKWDKPEGAKEDGSNYVIFNANDVKIKNKNMVNENINTQRVLYTAQVIDNPQELMSKYPSNLPNKFYHHSTNRFGKQPFDDREGEPMVLKIKGRLTNEYVDALVVDNPNSVNDIPHITLATADGIKPFQSNVELSKHPELIKPLNDTVKTTFKNICAK